MSAILIQAPGDGDFILGWELKAPGMGTRFGYSFLTFSANPAVVAAATAESGSS